MTNTLTEQWREGTLRGCFYWKLPNGNICTAYTDTMRDMKNVMDSNEVEVLEEAPSYYEYQDIIQQNVNQEAAIETYIEDIKCLHKQLKEANEVIKLYAETTVGHKQKDGTYRLSVATGTINFLDPFFGMKSEMQEYVYDPRPAKKYLKKWGVK